MRNYVHVPASFSSSFWVSLQSFAWQVSALVPNKKLKIQLITKTNLLLNVAYVFYNRCMMVAQNSTHVTYEKNITFFRVGGVLLTMLL